MNKKVLLVGVSADQKDFEYTMEELKNLALAGHYQIEDVITQNMERIHKATYVGKGKLAELADIVQMEEIDAVVLNDELSPSQIRNLEAALEVEIIDRTALILMIFANRAKTREAQLQVEIARLKYELPRLRGIGEELDQQGGRSGLANRGSGEKKLESDRRIIQNQIRHLNKELEEIAKERQVQRRKRIKNELPVVSLVGYTNAGKSTTMNGLVKRTQKAEHKQVFEKDMLFATLDTSVREITLADKKKFLLSDTVGFVSKLPTHLVKAFRSTLEEAAGADLLIHVVDYADPHYQAMIQTTEETLAKVGVENIPTIYAYNKADKLEGAVYPVKREDGLVFSAREEASLDFLMDLIRAEIFSDYLTVRLRIPYEAGDITSYLNEHAHILTTEYVEQGTELLVEISPADFAKLEKYLITQKEK
ncbi:GTPase HflX [Listeria costaricensis]|uniref:GTPase HflX n=1 Tax=Listeria costaricensis TaxID=2026604 RepID=UPI000C0800C9|nr:GTPase HflX [Listeria costaricensis]